jgi:hypothetical protein
VIFVDTSAWFAFDAHFRQVGSVVVVPSGQ